MSEPNYIITIGASAGGLNPLMELLAQVNEQMNASVFAVLHASNSAFENVLINRLQKNSVFTCKLAEHNETIQPHYCYLAPSDHHLMIKKGRILLGRGPVENRWRPSIDALFRSAAVSYTSRVIGVILTGLLEDGTSGMGAIKQCGGTCIVQDPAEAEYPDMPKAVMRNVKVDYCTSLQRIAIILHEKTINGVPEPATVPPLLAKEAQIAERVALGIEQVSELGKQAPYSCPDCGGALWEINQEGFIRFRCHTGHMFNADELLELKRKELENTFWVTIRILEERRNLLMKMSEEEHAKGWVKSAANKKTRAEELEVHMNRIKEILFQSTDNHDPTNPELDGK